jgi:predicted esterase
VSASAAAPVSASAAAPVSASAAAPAPAPSPTKIAVPLDQAVYVAHAPPGEQRAIVYLHGRCGDVLAFRAWARAAARYGTLIALQGDVPCKGGWRSTWSYDMAGLDRRIHRAIEAVSAARGSPLDAASITLVGYSLGAARVEGLAKRFPGRYERAILIAGPSPPEASSFPGAAAVVLMAGDRDRRRHLQEAAAALLAGGVPARFMLLPGARHGEYGPAGERVMGEALAWAFARAHGR